MYYGNYCFNKFSIQINAPDSIGVYYLGYLNAVGELIVLYVGKAAGLFSVVRSRLLEHLNDNRYFDVTHFGYKICGTENEAETLERSEIKSFQPKYNKIGK